ncbi:unnamed protein product [Dibothriocephalus latus]|uniref:Uncharacterized protein n=1 Tax=Dibothriocephalus latus TaxID=60516 RepID=A0A3P6U344_DIBLA|nr:unnamed protein product [Dibothriocephalus latus]
MTTISLLSSPPALQLAPSVCKAYGHCVPLTSFAPVVQVNNGIPTRGTYLGQPVMQGFAPIFPMPAKIASTGGYVSMPIQGTAGGGVQTEVGRRTISPDQLIFAPQFTSPKRMKPSGQQSPFNELPNFLPGLEEGRRSDLAGSRVFRYSINKSCCSIKGCQLTLVLTYADGPMILSQITDLQTGPLVGRVSNLRRPLNPQKDHEHGISGSDLEGHRWPSSEDIEANDEETEEEDDGRLAEAMNSQDHRRSSFRMKAATLQALHRSTSSDWHLPNNATPCDVQQQKFVKFSTSNISLNKLPSPPIRQNPTESHYV